ncbi:MAG: signal peptidase II [Gemmatimonadota bacterium]|nr:signal peptidase II [Gemmatimonadota bacterium]
MIASSARPAAKTIAFWSALAIVACGDFVTKRIAEATLALQVPHPVVGDWVRFTLLYNTGAALNISLGEFSRVGLSAVALAMMAVLYRMYRQTAAHDAWHAVALGLIAGGALGNLVDRIRSARGVVDFIDVGSTGWRFYTFNVADAGVTIGAVLLAAHILRRPSADPPGSRYLS